jgi:uncharacterized membrane protein
MATKPPKHQQDPKKSLTVRSQQYSGPIPPAEELAKFHQIDPSFPERIMKMAENHNNANTVEKVKLLHKGLSFLIWIISIMLLASIYFFYIKDYYAGAAFGITPFVYAIGTLLNKKSPPKS